MAVAVPSMDFMLGTRILLGLALFLCLQCSAEDDLKCQEATSCHCVTSNGSYIDLEPLAFTNSTPRFNKIPVKRENHTDNVSYNPCKPFTGEEECRDAAACRQLHDGDDILGNQILGKHENLTWTLVGEAPTVTYRYLNRSFEVLLYCNQNLNASTSSLEITKFENHLVRAILSSKYACFEAYTPTSSPSPPSPDGHKGLSTGSILVIAFFVLVILYLLGGVIYNKIIHGATGKELLPNVEFWISFPRLVVDGVAFTLNCCGKRKSSPDYDNV